MGRVNNQILGVEGLWAVVLSRGSAYCKCVEFVSYMSVVPDTWNKTFSMFVCFCVGYTPLTILVANWRNINFLVSSQAIQLRDILDSKEDRWAGHKSSSVWLTLTHDNFFFIWSRQEPITDVMGSWSRENALFGQSFSWRGSCDGKEPICVRKITVGEPQKFGHSLTNHMQVRTLANSLRKLISLRKVLCYLVMLLRKSGDNYFLNFIVCVRSPCG